MSTLAFASLTTRRVASRDGNGISHYIDVVAALVPAEVLSLHAVILSFTTETTQDAGGNNVTTITDPKTLIWSFWGLLVLSVFLYIIRRTQKFQWLDLMRMLIPPAAFIAWTMLQKATAFDAVVPDFSEAPRMVIAMFGAVVLGVIANALAKKAKPSDRNIPDGNNNVFVG